MHCRARLFAQPSGRHRGERRVPTARAPVPTAADVSAATSGSAPFAASSLWPWAVVLSAPEIFTFAAVLRSSPNQRVRANRTGSLVGAAGLCKVIPRRCGAPAVSRRSMWIRVASTIELMTFQTRDRIPLPPRCISSRPHSTCWSPQPGGHSRTWLIVSATHGRRRRVRRCRSARAPHRGACYCQESHIWARSTAPPGPKPGPTAPSHLVGQSGRRGSDQRSRHRDYGDAADRIRAPQLYRAGSPNLLCALQFRLHRIAQARPEQVAWRQRRGVAPNRVIDILAPRHQPRRPVTRTGSVAGGRDLRPHRPFRLPAGGIYSIPQRQPPTKE
jgi:hypothetical protein